MQDINEILETAHISVSSATLKVVVDDISKYKALMEPRKILINPGGNTDNIYDAPIYQEDPKWKEEMGFPDFVVWVSWWGGDSTFDTLSIFVIPPFDFKVLSDWLKTFE